MILILYNLALVTGLVVSSPWWLWRVAATQKYREGLLQRLGFVRPAFARGLEGPERRPVIWVHAVSVGEVLAVSGLVAELGAQMGGFRIVISTTTWTGQALARERFGEATVFYCPLDLHWAVRAYLEALQPRMLVLAETEFWPNLLHGCFRRGVPVVVVNARISDRSWPRYRRLRGLWRPFLSRLTRVLAQSEVDAERLAALGCPRVMVSGNLKFDVRVAQEAKATRLLRERAAGLRIVVAGSTLEGEEALLLAAWPALLKAEPGLALVLAPRHPERFTVVAALLAASGLRWRRRTELGADPAELTGGEIVLLDSIGELASVYSLACVAFVGGSLVAAGGHNPLEPAQFGVPVVVGDHYVNFRAIVEAMRARDAILVTDPNNLTAALTSLLRNGEATAAMGERGRAVFAAQAGATRRTVAAIGEVLNGVSV